MNVDGVVRTVSEYSTTFLRTKSIEYLRAFERQDAKPCLTSRKLCERIQAIDPHEIAELMLAQNLAQAIGRAGQGPDDRLILRQPGTALDNAGSKLHLTADPVLVHLFDPETTERLA
jgi:hypothetical protein